MWLADKWRDYEVLDASDGEKLERWGNIILIRPDPTAIWTKERDERLWGRANARYVRSKSGGGSWDRFAADTFSVSYGELSFRLKQFGFKHTGLFPEQAVNWDWFMPIIKNAGRPVRVLNLFAYTGGATMAAAASGASVCHVDAAKGMVAWAKDNAKACGLSDAPIRYIVDDCIKFIKREGRRGSRYDAVIMDPPSYGRGPDGEVFKIEEKLYELCELSSRLLSDDPLFFLVNSYTAQISPSLIENILKLTVLKNHGGCAEADEIGLPVKSADIVLPCGITGRVKF
ncbi:MAG: class I SAM-dependent methyltransferase [Clostridia bacterium]|nr:class I SAM-dependent methyltransferase [Clostridia bacterium]